MQVDSNNIFKHGDDWWECVENLSHPAFYRLKWTSSGNLVRAEFMNSSENYDSQIMDELIRWWQHLQMER